MYGNQRVIGILAHVDAGKTTLAEAFLYTAGEIREAGRVDHQDAFLDNDAMERKRGITIFSKQALFSWKGKSGRPMDVTLLDTPGHVDFSAEMERTLQVLDYAVLVVSGADGVQGHTKTLWGLLKQYGIPTFLFVNKMDQEGTDQERILKELREKLDENCITFSGWSKAGGEPDDGPCKGASPGNGETDDGSCKGAFPGNGETDDGPCKGIFLGSGEQNEELCEELSFCSEELMAEYLETGSLSAENIGEAIADRKVFPVYFGSALRILGVSQLLDGLSDYTLSPEYSDEFGARVFKISRDKQGNRLTHVKVTGGILRAKQVVGKEDAWEEKVDQIRLYNGVSFHTIQEAPAGTICALTGLSNSAVGDGLGFEKERSLPSLEPVLTYKVHLPEGYDPVVALGQLRRLEEEDPMLRVTWKESLKEIHVSVMGDVQVEILQNLLMERFGLEVSMEDGSIVYKETLAEPVLGVGHFEPLRHYAEVQLLLEPGERGSGLQFASFVSEDELDRNWQRLILTHLEERSYPGVLVGGEVTDLRISIVGGRAHVKHTEGGDFRQATYRAVRQGLRSGKSVLLEPVYEFSLELPAESLGRAMTDVQRMQGSFDVPAVEGEVVTLTGTAPASAMRDYQREVISYTKGRGKLSLALKGYEPCREAEEIIRAQGYDPEADFDNPASSVFCSHGAGTVVPWDQVWAWAHVPLRRDYLEAAIRWQEGAEDASEIRSLINANKSLDGGMTGFSSEDLRLLEGVRAERTASMDRVISQEEIDAIFAAGRKNQNRKQADKAGYRRYHRGNRRAETGREQGGPAPGSRQQRPENGAGTGSARQDPAGRPTSPSRVVKAPKEAKESCILVDGYNVIHAWPELMELMQVNVGSARDRLIREMSNYQGYVGGVLILVFDAYKVKGNPGSVEKTDNIYVVYTKEAETADQYIEKTVHDMASKYKITVATSDGLEQMIIWGDGALRMSSLGLLEDLRARGAAAREQYGITEE